MICTAGSDCTTQYPRRSCMASASTSCTPTPRQAMNVTFVGPQMISAADHVPAVDLQNVIPANVPGLITDGYDWFNIHMHGMETQPHLFHPMGNSEPSSEWISILPYAHSGQQCYCYRFTVADSMPRGQFMYHTHRHGSAAMLTWSAMLGYVLTGKQTVEPPPVAVEPATLVTELMRVAKDQDVAFAETDIKPYVLYDSPLRFQNVPWPADQLAQPTPLPPPSSPLTRDVEVVDFEAAHRYTTNIQGVFVGNLGYQPTLFARAGAFSLFRIMCISSARLCGFQIVDPSGAVVPFHHVASDGITFARPVLRRATGGWQCPYLGSSSSELPGSNAGSEAYFSLGGGQREDIVVQFTMPGTYYIHSRTCSVSTDMPPTAASLIVTDPLGCSVGSTRSCPTFDLSKESFEAAALQSIESRPVKFHRALSFVSRFNQEQVPFLQFGVGNAGEANDAALLGRWQDDSFRLQLAVGMIDLRHEGGLLLHCG